MTKQSTSSRPIIFKDADTKVNVVEGVLQNYLDQLLVTATLQPQKVEKVIEIQDEVVLEDVLIAEAIDTAPAEPAEIEPAEIEPAEIEPVEIESVTSTDVDINVKESLSLTDPDSWSSQGVECLVFSVCGLKLAVPLLFLGGVHEVAKGDVKPLVGQPVWYLGMMHTDEHNLQVIDTASLIMPEREQYLAEQGFKYLIQLEKTPWAIACQSIDDTVRLDASEIKWRGERGKRTWLAGTVIEKMCALIDVNGLLQHVDRSCKPI